MTRLVIRGARWPGDIAVRDGRIEAVGTVPPQDGDEVLRADGDLVTAGFVNTHHHLYQWLTRGWAADQGLFGWLSTLYPVWARIDADDVHAAALVGLAELALSGCSTAADHHYVVPRGDDWSSTGSPTRPGRSAIRAHLARGSMDLGESAGGLPPDAVVEDTEAILASTEAVHARLHDGEQIFVTVAPCSPFSVTPAADDGVAPRWPGGSACACTPTWPRPRTRSDDTPARFGVRPVELMRRWDWIAGDVWVAHGIHFDDAEIALLGRDRHRRRALPVQQRPPGRRDVPGQRPARRRCPGRPRRRRRGQQRGRRPAARTAAGPLHEPAAHRRRHLAVRPAGPGDRHRGRRRLPGRPRHRPAQPGARADLAIWPGDDLADVLDPVAGLALGPDRKVRHLLVQGRYVVRDGELVHVDLVKARAELAARARRLWP